MSRKGYYKEYYAKNRESRKAAMRASAQKRRERIGPFLNSLRGGFHLKQRLRETFAPPDALERLERLEGVCPICGEKETGNKRLALDHDHSTGLFRGFICARCNRVMGFVGESIQTLSKMIEYLTRGGL